MKQYHDVLRECPLFIQVDDDNLWKMLFCLGAKIKHFKKNNIILSEGSPAGHIGIVLTGSIQVIRFDYYGNRSILSKVSPGELFCEAFACAEVASVPVTVVANETCDVMLLDHTHILHTCANNCGFHQQLIFNLMKDLAIKTLDFHQRIEITSKRTTREKLLTYLNYYAKKSANNRFDIPFNRQELADYLEVDRSGLSAEISKLRNEGVLRCTKNHFELLEHRI